MAVRCHARLAQLPAGQGIARWHRSTILLVCCGQQAHLEEVDEGGVIAAAQGTLHGAGCATRQGGAGTVWTCGAHAGTQLNTQLAVHACMRICLGRWQRSQEGRCVLPRLLGGQGSGANVAAEQGEECQPF